MSAKVVEDSKICKKSTTIHEKNLICCREIRVDLKVYFNWKHSSFQVYKKTKINYYKKKKKNCIKTGLSDQK